MAFETELGNVVTPTDVISDRISAPLVQAVVATPLIYTEDLPVGTNKKKFRKEGSLTAETIAESADYTFSASSEYTETSVLSTAAKSVCISKATVEMQQFAETMSLGKLADAQGKALARAMDAKILALTSGLSQVVTATNVLTVNDVLQALYLVQSSTAGVSGGKLRAIIDFKGANELRKEIISSGAAAFSQESMTTLLAGIQQLNGFVGSLPGVDLFQSSGLPTTGGDDIAAVFDPDLCFAGVVGVVDNRSAWKGSEGLFDELTGWIFNDFVEWNDLAGCGLRSDT
jgi:hypothetical protein